MDFCFRCRHGLIHPFYHADHKNTMNHLLEIDSLTLNFGTRNILNDIYLHAETGKITALWEETEVANPVFSDAPSVIWNHKTFLSGSMVKN